VRRVALTCALVIVSGFALAPSSLASVRVPVKRCPTTYAIPGQKHTFPTHTTVSATAVEARAIVAWAGGGTPIVLAPPGFACKALVGADGGVHVQLAPPGAGKQGPAVDVEVEGACIGCITAVACGLFPGAAKDMAFPCKTPRPKGERVAKLLPTVRAFIDPAGVHGTGSPSGGSLPAVGAVVYAPSLSAFAARVTCTVGKADAPSCQTIIADFLARVGSG
jgi:Domain of unknown function (DUF4850)